MYYYGRIKAIQLEYTEALDYLVKSLRKAPSSAVGFRQTVEKLRVTVELLLGNIPERQLFLQQANKEALAPYFELTKGIYEVSLRYIQLLTKRKSADHIAKCIIITQNICLFSCKVWRTGQVSIHKEPIY